MLFTPQKSRKNKKSRARRDDRSIHYQGTFEDNPETFESEEIPQPSESGLLLIQSRDPLSRLVSYITRQEYTVSGIYKQYPSKPTRINLINIFDGNVPNWGYDINTLEELERSNCVTKILLYPYNTNNNSNSNNNNNNNNNNDSNTNNTTIKMQHPDDNSISTRELLINLFGGNLITLPGIRTIVSYLYSHNDVPKVPDTANPIKNLIENSDLIVVPPNKILIDPAIERSFKKDRKKLSEIVATFVDMLLSDKDFLDLVCGKYLNRVHSYDLLYDLVLQHVNVHNSTIDLVQDWVQNGKIDKESLNRIIIDLNDTSIKTGDIMKEKTIDEFVQVEDLPDQLIVLDKTPEPTIVDSISVLQNQVESIVNTIKKGEVPCIELNSIIETVNNLSEYYSLDMSINTITKPSSGLLIISPDKDISIPLSLKSGNKILLTTLNFDLSMFERSELIEILEILETNIIDVIITDDRYDHIRAEITEEIAKR